MSSGEQRGCSERQKLYAKRWARRGRPAFRSYHERNLTAVRGRLGKEAFKKTWAEGQEMTAEQAVKYALEWPTEPETPVPLQRPRIPTLPATEGEKYSPSPVCKRADERTRSADLESHYEFAVTESD